MVERIKNRSKVKLEVLPWAVSSTLVVILVALASFYHSQHVYVYNEYALYVQTVVAIVIVIWAVAFMLKPEIKHDVWRDLKAYVAIFITVVIGTLGAVGLIKDTNILLSGTLTVLVILTLAVRHDRLRQDELLIEIQHMARGASTIKAFATWDQRELCDIISTAKKSIEVIDSNCSEHHFWATRTREALENGALNLTVSIYMLDPKKIFGAQRLLEMKGHVERKKVSSDSSLMEPHKEKYQQEFDRNCNDLWDAIGLSIRKKGGTATLTIYKYPTMPCLRAIIVDGSEYIFGWFPLNDLNPTHACFFISGSSILTASDREAIKCLEHHINEIRNDCTQVYPEKATEVSLQVLAV